jgi:hypothetical protein
LVYLKVLWVWATTASRSSSKARVC